MNAEQPARSDGTPAEETRRDAPRVELLEHDGSAAAPLAAGQPGATLPDDQDEGFDQAQQAALVLIGQALIEQSLPGTAAIELVVAQRVTGQDVDLDFRLQLVRESGLAMPSAAGDALVTAVQRLVLLWREHGREPWRTFSYRLLRGESGPRFTSEFDY